MARDTDTDDRAGSATRWGPARIERMVKLGAGLVLMVFVTTHLLNHAAGVLGLETMSYLQDLRTSIWRGPAGAVLLYGALAVHVVLAFRRVLRRSTWRMPWGEAVQIVLGLLIPIMLVQHVGGTRLAYAVAEVDDSYLNVLRYIWPSHALMQIAALLVVWIHGCLGFYFAFHVNDWFRRMRLLLSALALLIPALAIAGFVAAGREASRSTEPLEIWSPAQLERILTAGSWAKTLVWALLLAAVAAIAVKEMRRRFSRSFAVRYTGHGEVRGSIGPTLLEISRMNRIPHPSSCGGRGRCSSCRVLVTQGADSLPAPEAIERRLLDRIQAQPNVRLACQVKPSQPIEVRVLMAGQSEAGIGFDPGRARTADVTVLVSDVRAFSYLARTQLPGDTVQMLNRIVDELVHATVAHGGHVAGVQTDGITAIFGLGGDAKAGALAALNCAADMQTSIEAMNAQYESLLPIPLRLGVGIHHGAAVIAGRDDDAKPGRADQGAPLAVIGDTVAAAARLEEATKEAKADCLISEQVFAAAAIAPPPGAPRQVVYKQAEEPLRAYAVNKPRPAEPPAPGRDRDRREPA